MKSTYPNKIFSGDQLRQMVLIRSLMMGTETVPETSVLLFNHLTRLIARDFIVLRRRENSKSRVIRS